MKFPRDPLLGTAIGKGYQILSVLREGDLGREYQGCNAEGTSVTVKVLYGELAALERVRARFVREAKRASAVVHPNVMPVLDVAATPSGLPFLVTPLLEGRRLGEILQTSKRLSHAHTRALLEDLCSGLAAIHKSGIIHGHLSPANILLVPDRDTTRSIILDLEISLMKATARASYRSRAGQYVTGDPYAAPELMRATRHDHRIDLYSVGALLYQMRTGVVPVADAAPRGEIPASACPGDDVEVDRLGPSSSLESVILRLIEPDPNDRYPAAIDVMTAIERCSPRRNPSEQV